MPGLASPALCSASYATSPTPRITRALFREEFQYNTRAGISIPGVHTYPSYAATV